VVTELLLLLQIFVHEGVDKCCSPYRDNVRHLEIEMSHVACRMSHDAYNTYFDFRLDSTPPFRGKIET
jgi:hypothetical protein